MYNISVKNDNSYLIKGIKTAIVDGVSAKNAEEHIRNIQSSLNGSELNYIILNTTMPENIGSVERLLQEYPSVKIISSTAGIKNLSELLNSEFEYVIAKDGSMLDLGMEKTISFYILPNLPWTDSMVSYSEGILFCGSIFSDDENYYDNKIKPFKEYGKNAVERLSEIQINKLVPYCGNEITDINLQFEKYEAVDDTEEYAVVLYSSRYGFTAEMAQIVCSIFEDTKINVKCINTDETDRQMAAAVLNNCSCFMVGTNTINRNASGSVWDVITRIDMINKNHTPCFIFGSCGWSGEGVYLVERFLKSIRMNVFEKPFLVKFKMSDDEKIQLKEYTKRFIDKRE